MTANPDSALRQALHALTPFKEVADMLDVSGATFDDDTRGVWVRISGAGYAGSKCFDASYFRRAREAHALITEALQQHKGGEGMIFTDWLFHKYIRKGERIKLIRNAAASYATVKDILGFGKYAPVMLEPTGAIRRDGIQRGPDGEWTYNYDESSGE